MSQTLVLPIATPIQQAFLIPDELLPLFSEFDLQNAYVEIDYIDYAYVQAFYLSINEDNDQDNNDQDNHQDNNDKDNDDKDNDVYFPDPPILTRQTCAPLPSQLPIPYFDDNEIL